MIYFGPKIHSLLNWQSHANKLSQENAMLFRVRDLITANVLKSIYYTFSKNHINYACISLDITLVQLIN